MKERKATTQSLVEEISVILKDEIVARFTEEESALQIHLHNGKTFRVEVTEM